MCFINGTTILNFTTIPKFRRFLFHERTNYTIRHRADGGLSKGGDPSLDLRSDDAGAECAVAQLGAGRDTGAGGANIKDLFLF